MKTIKLETLTKEAFAPFGEYYKIDAPEGYPLTGELHRYFPDRLSTTVNGLLGFSPILVKKPAEMKITQIEYHTTTAELLLPLSDDMVLHVAPPSAGKPVPDYTRAFLVPRNTIIKLMPGVWHLAPLPANADELTALVILPVCTYMNDCTVVDLKEDEQFVIEK